MYKGFAGTRRYYCNHCSFIYKSLSKFFEISVLSWNFWGNVYHVSEINLISSWNLIKALSLPSVTNSNKFEIWFCRRKTSEDDVKINVSTDIPCTFLLLKASAYLQIFFPRKTSFKFCTTTYIEYTNYINRI